MFPLFQVIMIGVVVKQKACGSQIRSKELSSNHLSAVQLVLQQVQCRKKERRMWILILNTPVTKIHRTAIIEIITSRDLNICLFS